MVGLLSPMTTAMPDAVSYFLLACGTAFVGGGDPRLARWLGLGEWGRANCSTGD